MNGMTEVSNTDLPTILIKLNLSARESNTGPLALATTAIATELQQPTTSKIQCSFCEGSELDL